MYSNIPRDAEYIARLLDFIRREYPIEPMGISPAKRGFFGETWRVDTAERRYFVKLDYSVTHQGIYERSFPIVEHLNAHGIDFINKIVPTAHGALSARYDGAVLGVFDWIDGENIENDATKQPEYRMLAKIYAVLTDNLAIPREDFGGKIADKFFAQWERLRRNPGAEAARICALFEQRRETLTHLAERLKYFAKRCAEDDAHFYLTHGDAGGNLIANGDRYAIVDWDDPILAPPERDGWVMECFHWAQAVFQAELAKNGIHYTLRPERLAYYCYHFCIFYLTEFLEEFERTGTAEVNEEFFDGWIAERMRYADGIE